MNGNSTNSTSAQPEEELSLLLDEEYDVVYTTLGIGHWIAALFMGFWIYTNHRMSISSTVTFYQALYMWFTFGGFFACTGGLWIAAVAIEPAHIEFGWRSSVVGLVQVRRAIGPHTLSHTLCETGRHERRRMAGSEPVVLTRSRAREQLALSRPFSATRVRKVRSKPVFLA